jgi:hypothetical protein
VRRAAEGGGEATLARGQPPFGCQESLHGKVERAQIEWFCMKRLSTLPFSLPPIGLAREAAAEFIRVSPSKFEEDEEDAWVCT